MSCIVRHFRPHVLLSVLGSLALAVGQARADLVAGFDTGADLQRWSAQGSITVQRTEGPPGPQQAGPTGPAGSAARIDTAGNSGLFIKAGQLPPDLSDFDTLRFWVHRDPGAAAPSTIEVRFYEANGTAWFWRKVVLDQPGWTEVMVPFKWTRWSPTRIPRWEKVNRLGIFFRDAADVVVDSFSLADDPPPNGPDDKPVLTADDVATLAFGAAAADASKVRIVAADGITVITDAPDCEAETLRAHLAKLPAVVAAVQKSGSTAIEPLLPVLGLSRDELDAKWRAFCRQHYGS